MAIKIVKNLNFPNNSDTFQINAVTLEGKTADTVITEARIGLATEDYVDSAVNSIPAATSTTLGKVKIGANITVSSGTISLTKSNVTTALGYTPPTTDAVTSIVDNAVNSLGNSLGDLAFKDSLTAAQVGAVPTSRTVNGKALSANITLSAADVGATTLINRTNAVNVANTNYTTLMARGSSLNSEETTPAVNGAIAWTYS